MLNIECDCRSLISFLETDEEKHKGLCSGPRPAVVLLEDVGSGDVHEVQGYVDQLPRNILLSRKHHHNVEDRSWKLLSKYTIPTMLTQIRMRLK